MRTLGLRAALFNLVALSLLAVTLTVPALAKEEYQTTATLQSPVPESGVQFGYSVAVSEDIIVIGELRAEVNGFIQAGKAYIFDLDGNLKATLQAPTPQPLAKFGTSVAVSGEIVVVGERYANVGGKSGAGKAYIFNSDGNLKATLQSPEPDSSARFGRTVAVSGDTVIVSETSAVVEGLPLAGKAYLYDLDWTLLTTLQSPEPYTGYGSGNFGYSVAGSGGIIVVGEPVTALDDILQAGRAFIFDSDGNLLKTLKSPEPQTEGNFGISVAVSEDIMVIGEYWAEVDGYSKVGRAYIFDLDGNLLTNLLSPELEENAFFGSSVATSGDLIIVGEPGADGESEDEGRAYVFDPDGNLVATLKAPEPTEDAEFGSPVAVSGEIVVVGEQGASIEGKFRAGRVYIFQAGAAAFTSSGLSIDPSSVDVGGTVTISLEVTNTGAKSGTHTVALKIDGEVEDEKTVTLDPDERETVSFQVSAPQLGSFSVEVDGLSGSYTVTEPIEEEKKPSGGIPGFPYESIILGLILGTVVVWLIKRRL